VSGPDQESPGFSRGEEVKDTYDQYNDPFLRNLHNELVEEVAARIDRALNEDPDLAEIVPDDSMEEQAIAAEREPVITRLLQLGLTDRILSSDEEALVRSRSMGDRPAARTLIELGRELTEMLRDGLDPFQDLGFHPTAYLPTEVMVIGRAANLDPYHLPSPQRPPPG
jgi:hypothetical protein